MAQILKMHFPTRVSPVLLNYAGRQTNRDVVKCVGKSLEPQLSLTWCRLNSNITQSKCSMLLRTVPRLRSNQLIQLQQTRNASNQAVAPLNWKRLGISVALVGAVFWGAHYYKKEKELMMEMERRRSLGKASIGGAFELTDHLGNLRRSTDFLGKWVLMYFGFTHCPDICPDELEKMVKAVDMLQADGISIVPLFVSVDPDRDSVAAVAGYIKEFSDKLIGLTGTKEQVAQATKNYRVYYSAGPRDHENDYIVDHTIIMYLINPDGEFVDYFGQTKTAEDINRGVAMAKGKYDAIKKKGWLQDKLNK